MNYSDVESKVSIIDNSSSSAIGFMPVWNNKTLHLVVDTDNGTSSTIESNHKIGRILWNEAHLICQQQSGLKYGLLVESLLWRYL